MMKLAEKIQSLRIAAGLSLAAMAEIIGISRQAYQKIEAGRVVNPKIDTLIAIANFYRITVSELIGDPGMELRREGKSVLREEESRMLVAYREISQKQQRLVLSLMEQFKEK